VQRSDERQPCVNKDEFVRGDALSEIHFPPVSNDGRSSGDDGGRLSVEEAATCQTALLQKNNFWYNRVDQSKRNKTMLEGRASFPMAMSRHYVTTLLDIPDKSAKSPIAGQFLKCSGGLVRDSRDSSSAAGADDGKDPDRFTHKLNLHAVYKYKPTALETLGYGYWIKNETQCDLMHDAWWWTLLELQSLVVREDETCQGARLLSAVGGGRQQTGDMSSNAPMYATAVTSAAARSAANKYGHTGMVMTKVPTCQSLHASVDYFEAHRLVWQSVGDSLNREVWVEIQRLALSPGPAEFHWGGEKHHSALHKVKETNMTSIYVLAPTAKSVYTADYTRASGVQPDIQAVGAGTWDCALYDLESLMSRVNRMLETSRHLQRLFPPKPTSTRWLFGMTSSSEQASCYFGLRLRLWNLLYAQVARASGYDFVDFFLMTDARPEKSGGLHWGVWAKPDGSVAHHPASVSRLLALHLLVRSVQHHHYHTVMNTTYRTP
jgi:hypothetical protein